MPNAPPMTKWPLRVARPLNLGFRIWDFLRHWWVIGGALGICLDVFAGSRYEPTHPYRTRTRMSHALGASRLARAAGGAVGRLPARSVRQVHLLAGPLPPVGRPLRAERRLHRLRPGRAA